MQEELDVRLGEADVPLAEVLLDERVELGELTRDAARATRGEGERARARAWCV